MAIRDTMLTLKNKEGTLTNNKVCNFAYDDTAFADDTATGANGVVNYNYNNHNNIPVKDNAVIKVNPTITSKGFRSQVSTLPRMLLNHIFGRVSYNLNKTVDTLNATLQALYSAIGQANGIATLDNTGRLPYSQLPLSAVEYKGAWNASTNTPALSSGSGTFGDEYIVSVQGTRDLGEGSVTYRVGDRVIYNGSIWQRIPSSSVRSVNAKTPDANGNVTVNAGDIVTPDVYGYDKQEQGIYWGTIADSPYFQGIEECNGIFIAGSNRLFNEGLWYSLNGTQFIQSNITSGGIDYQYPRRIKDWLVYTEGLFVAVLDTSALSSAIYYSRDGKTWTLAYTSTGALINGIKYLAGMWFICIEKKLYVSLDLINWTVKHEFDEVIADICYSKGTYVVAIYDAPPQTTFTAPVIFKSTDLTNWTSSNLSVHRNSQVQQLLVYHNGTSDIFCVAILELSGGSQDACIYYSEDLITWTLTFVDHVHYFRSGWQKLYQVGNKLVAVGRLSGYVYFSDGITEGGDTHIPFSISSGINIYGFTYDRGLYLLLTSQGIYYTSDPDVTSSWQKVYLDGSSMSALTVQAIYAKGLWIAIGEHVYYSAGAKSNNVKTILDQLIYAVDNMLA